jgi:hypothetical protein
MSIVLHNSNARKDVSFLPVSSLTSEQMKATAPFRTFFIRESGHEMLFRAAVLDGNIFVKWAQYTFCPEKGHATTVGEKLEGATTY